MVTKGRQSYCISEQNCGVNGWILSRSHWSSLFHYPTVSKKFSLKLLCCLFPKLIGSCGKEGKKQRVEGALCSKTICINMTLSSINPSVFRILSFSRFSHDLQLHNNFKQLILPRWACLIPCCSRGTDGIEVEAVLQRPCKRMENWNISQELRQQDAYNDHHQKGLLHIWRVHRHTLG